MSYEVSVFEWTAPEEPPSFEAVQEIVKIKERERQPRGNPKFAALAQAVLRQFPNGLLMNDADPSRDDAVEWPDDPAASAANVEVGVWRIYLPGQQRLAVLKFLVEHAEGLGLAVLDEQIPLTWLPSGRMLPEIAGEAWVDACNEAEMPVAEPADPPLKLSAARKQMVAELRKVLVSKGWTITSPKDYEADIHAWRKGEGWRQEFVGNTSKLWDDIRWTATLVLGNEGVSAIFEQALGIDVAIMITPGWLIGGDVLVSTSRQVLDAVDLIADRLLPLADMGTALKGLHRILNTDLAPVVPVVASGAEEPAKTFLGRGLRERDMSALVVAWLVGDKQCYEELKKYYAARYEKLRSPPALDMLARLTDYLESKVLPNN